MIEKRVVAGPWVLVAALGCTPHGATKAPRPGAPPGGAAATGDDLRPTEQLEALREEIAQAGGPRALDPERCTIWAEALIGLHLRHGQPYVGARLEAATLLRECGQPHEATEWLLDGLDAMPRWAHAEALNTLGVLAHESGDDGGALVHFDAALRADPALHEARANAVRLLMRIYEDGGSRFARDDAQHHLETWLELAPEDPRVRVLEARLMVISARREPEAADRLRQEAELQLSHVVGAHASPAVAAEAYVALGQLALDRDDESVALLMFKRALELDPGRADAALPGATAAIHMRDFEGARQMLEDAARTVDPLEERTRLRLLAVALRGVRRYQDATAIYDQLLAVEEPDPVDMYNRAHLELYKMKAADHFELAQLEATRDWFRKVIVATHGDPAYAELERRSQAEIVELDQLLADETIFHAVEAETARLVELERKQRSEERKRRLKLEAKARKSFERSQAEAAAEAEAKPKPEPERAE